MSRKRGRGIPIDGKSTEELLNFLAEKSKHATSPLNINQLSRDFLEKNQISRPFNFLSQRIYKLRPEMSKLKGFDVETKVRMLFALSAPICAKFLNELRNNAIVEVDGKKRITKYKEEYGSLELNGDHSNSAKHKSCNAEKRRNMSQWCASDHSEALKSGGQYGKEVKCKTGWAERQRERRQYFSSEDSEDEVDQQANTSNIKNIKMSNSTSNIDFTSGNSEFKCSIGENVKRQRTVKTEMSKNASNFPSSSGIPQHKKRRLNTRTIQMIQRDVVYDGPGEPPRPFQLPAKRETPAWDHIDFYSNQHYLRTEDNRVDNVELGESSEYGSNRNYEIGNTQYLDDIVKVEEPENPDIICDTTFVPVNTSSYLLDQEIQRNRVASLTSSKKFLEGIHNLVRTLDSPWLTKLQKKIEKSLEKFEKEDHKIPTDDILTILNGCLLIVSKNATLTSSEASTSLKGFLLILRSALYTLNSPDFDNLQKKIKEAIDGLGDSNKKVPITKLRSALETVVEVATP